MQTLSRSQLKAAPYNPRQKLSRHKRQKLEKNLRSVGLLGPVIWNKRTGHVVGGHQRLEALDALEEGQDYELDVSVVDLAPEVEHPQNVFLNNPLVQGTWDMELLGDLLRKNPGGVEATGFDPMDVQVMFDDAKLAPLFNDESNDALMQDIARIGGVRPERAAADDPDDMGDLDEPEPRAIIGKERQHAVLEAEGGRLLDDDYEDDDADIGRDELDGRDEPTDELPESAKFEREKWQKIKAEQKERMQARQQEDDTEYYAVVGFASAEQRRKLCVALGIEARAAFADGSRVMAKLRRAQS